MTVRLIESTFDECEIGVSVAHGTDVDVEKTAFRNTGIAVEVRDQAALLPKEVIQEILDAISGGADEAAVKERFSSTLKRFGIDIDLWLSRAGNLATIATALDAALGGMA